MSKRQKIVLMLSLGSLLAHGQAVQNRLSGRIEPTRGDLGPLYVELRDTAGHAVVERTPVAADGSFAVDAPSGFYDVRVVTGMHDDIITQEYVQINPMNGPLVVRLPQPAATPHPVSGTISVKELQARVPKKAWQAFVKAQQYSEAGRTQSAIEQLQRAIAVDPVWRDAHGNLGVQFMRMGRIENGLAEFREALRIGPPSAQLYTNLGAALAALRRVSEAEAAVRMALQLDASDSKAQYLLGHMLAVQPGREKEALQKLMQAETQVPAARIVAAEVLLRMGDRARAAEEVHTYLQLPDRAYRRQAETLLQRIGQ